jgi:ribonucleoside-triphosphate reductase
MEKGEKNRCCDKDNCCGRTRCEVFSRIVGYLRPVMQWNPGKVSEFAKRVTYQISK